jgi:phage-related protein (TIGR01555 family)
MSMISRLRDAVAVFGFGTALATARADTAAPGMQGGTGTGSGGWANLQTGNGTSRDPAMATTYGYQVPLPEAMRDNLYDFEATTRIVVDRPAKDMLRRGITFKGFEAFDLTPLKSKIDDLKMLKRIRTAYKWMRKDGGAAIILIVQDGRPAYMPIDHTRLQRVHALQVVERRQLSIAAWNQDPTSAGYGEPLMYYVHNTGPRSPMNLVHADRVIRFVGGDLPHRRQQVFGGWGVSVIDQIWNPLRAKGAALAALATILSSFAVDVVTITGFKEAVQYGNKTYMQDRADAMRGTLGNLSKIFLEPGETFQPVVRSVSGLAEIVGIQIEEVQACSSIPTPILRGLSPGGLNSGEDAAVMRGYYDMIDGETEEYALPAATRIIDLVVRSQIGPMQGRGPDHWWIEANPLWQPTDAERATTRAAHAGARNSDWMSGNMSREEWRSNVQAEGFYDLEDDDEALDAEGDATPFPTGHTPMTTRAVATQFGVNPGTIRTLIKSGAITNYNLNGRYVVSLQEVMQQASAAKTPGPIDPGPPVAVAA